MYNNLFIREVKFNKKKDIDLEKYIRDIPWFENMNKLKFNKNISFLIGENGVGKSTLLEAIATAYGFNPEGGSINFNFQTKDTHSNLYKMITLVKGIKRPKDGFFLRAESFYNVSTEIDRLNEITPTSFLELYGGKSLHKQSHGESFISLLLNRFLGNGLYILDEPEAALSPQNQLVLISKILELAYKGSQFIISTHSPMLMAIKDSEIFEITFDKIKLTSLKETNHYIITKTFLDNPEGMMNTLID